MRIGPIAAALTVLALASCTSAPSNGAPRAARSVAAVHPSSRPPSRPSPARPYHKTYHYGNWRPWWDFGTGTVGDFGCHTLQMFHDELEMGAPDFDESEMEDVGASAPVIAEPEAASEPRIVAENADASIAPGVGVEAQSSLGASLLASGIITRTPTRSDPLAPIRRMTQAEKIAFFS